MGVFQRSKTPQQSLLLSISESSSWINDETEKGVRSVEKKMKKWDSKHGVAEKFNNTMEKSRKALQEWDDKVSKEAIDGLERCKIIFDRMCFNACIMVDQETFSMDHFDDLYLSCHKIK